MTSHFLDFHNFRKTEKERERGGERERVNSLQGSCSFLIFISQLLHPELLSVKEYRDSSLDKLIAAPEH